MQLKDHTTKNKVVYILYNLALQFPPHRFEGFKIPFEKERVSDIEICWIQEIWCLYHKCTLSINQFFFFRFDNKKVTSQPKPHDYHFLRWITIALKVVCLYIFAFNDACALLSFFWHVCFTRTCMYNITKISNSFTHMYVHLIFDKQYSIISKAMDTVKQLTFFSTFFLNLKKKICETFKTGTYSLSYFS